MILVTRCDLVTDAALAALMERLDRLAPGVPKATAQHAATAVTAYPDGTAQAPSALSGKRVGLFCSLGNPEAFRQTVERLGATVEWAADFPDHHWYTPEDVAGIVRADNRAMELFVTTEKDAVKLSGLWPKDKKLWVLRVELRILSGEGELETLLGEALRASKYDERKEAQEKE
jgi:tetraacyldisaccharide 4'-kinase